MKKPALILLASLIIYLPKPALAQQMPQPPASWTEFQQQENAKREAFNKQLDQDRTNFLNSHPEVRNYFQEMKSVSQARLQAWKASHPK